MNTLKLLFENHSVYKIEEQTGSYFGGNPSRLLIILEKHSSYFFSSPHYYFLARILKALNLNYSQVGLIEAPDQLYLDSIFEKNLKPEKLILFGHHDILNRSSHYEESYYHSIPYFFGPHLESLYNDPIQKKEFWLSLKKFMQSLDQKSE